MRLLVSLSLAALALVAGTKALSAKDVVSEEWELWMLRHSRNYTDKLEEKFRLKIYMENKIKIARHNQLAHKGHKSYFLKMNHFGDLVSNSMGNNLVFSIWFPR